MPITFSSLKEIIPELKLLQKPEENYCTNKFYFVWLLYIVIFQKY